MRGMNLHPRESSALGQCRRAGIALDQRLDLALTQRPGRRKGLGQTGNVDRHSRRTPRRLPQRSQHLPTGMIDLHPGLRAVTTAGIGP
ncbi:hypothetical protein FQZ97_1123660 [compost metagenome]